MDDRNKQKRELINKLTDQENHVKSIFHFLSIWNTIDITWNGCLCPATEAEVMNFGVGTLLFVSVISPPIPAGPSLIYKAINSSYTADHVWIHKGLKERA